MHLRRRRPNERVLNPSRRSGRFKTKRIDQCANWSGSFAALPRDENVPSRAFVGNRNNHDVRHLRVPNEHWSQGDGVLAKCPSVKRGRNKPSP